MIAGKIIPAIATTNEAITGLVCFQLYTLLQTNDITYLRSGNINLAISMFLMMEPVEVRKERDEEFNKILGAPIKVIPKDFTVWDKIVVESSHTFKEFFNMMQTKYGVDSDIVNCGGVMLIWTFQPSAKDKMNKKIEDVYAEMTKSDISKRKYLVLKIEGNIDDAVVKMPLIQYNFR